MDLICCIDTGTTNIKTALIDERGKLVAVDKRPMPYFDNCQFSAEEVFQSVCDGIRSVVSTINKADNRIVGVSFTGQRATVVPLGRDSLASGPGITWQDISCNDSAKFLFDQFREHQFTEITGLPQSSIWTVAKLAGWKAGIYDWETETTKFALLSDYLLFRFGSEKIYTDYSNASVTGLYNTSRKTWSRDILFKLGISHKQLPEIVAAGTQVGNLSTEAATKCNLDEKVGLLVGAGDQQCATLGGRGKSAGDAVLCLGSAAILNCPVAKPVLSESSGFFCTAHAVPGLWVVESIHNTFGTSMSWKSKLLGMNSKWELQDLAKRAAGRAEGLLFFPFLAGIGSPDYNASVRGGFLGLSINDKPPEMARAVLEGICFELRRILEIIATYQGDNAIMLSGGSSESDFLTQLIADVTGQPLLKLSTGETTVLGLAALTWFGLGRFPTIFKAVDQIAAAEQVLISPFPRDDYEVLYSKYIKGVELLKQFATTTNSNHN